jgi:hypothetical protein
LTTARFSEEDKISLSPLVPVQLEMEKARSPSKVKERTHEEATEAKRARREGRHPEAAFAGEGAHIEVMR